MAKAKVTIDFKFPKYFEAVQAALPRIERTIASTIQTQVGMRFDAEGGHNGHEKWKGLKMRQGQILSLTGILRKSVSPPGATGEPGADGFVRHQGSVMDLLTEVGTKLIYAGTHDKGAIIRPKNKQALRFMIPGTNKFVFTKKSVIPARPFTDMNEVDKRELEETLSNLVAEILEHA